MWLELKKNTSIKTMTHSKTTVRISIIISYIVITFLLVHGIAALIHYVNTGADRSKMLHIELQQKEQYIPKLSWKIEGKKGRSMNDQTISDIKKDYLKAWYVRHIAYQTNEAMGLDDYYTKSAKKNIINTINQNKLENIHVAETTLEHHINIEYFSEDGALVVLTDTNVLEYKRIYKDNAFQLENYERATYKVILLFEDGFWRIRHLIREESAAVELHHTPRFHSKVHLKGINYYPQKTPWNLFGVHYNTSIIATDFATIKSAGLNSIRIFIPYRSFQNSKAHAQQLKKLKQLLDTAQKHQIKVMITLFDFYGDYTVLNWTLAEKHATTVVSQLKDHPALLAWDIKNEPDLDFESRGKMVVTSWLKRMLFVVKSIDNKHPVTIGWSNAKSAVILSDEVDLVSFHYYEKPADFKMTLEALQQQVSNKQIILTEFGLSSYKGVWNLFTGSEIAQENYYKTMQQLLRKEKTSFMSWTLYDFNSIPKEVVGVLPWRRNTQAYYGFIAADGRKKNSFKYISSD